MEYYDVIIIGAGIAGCGLAYNLKRIGYKGSVLIIDKNEVGGNKKYNVRTTFSGIKDKYNLPYFQRYKGFKMHVYDKFYMMIDNEPVYSVHYDAICKSLLRRAKTDFKKETLKKATTKKMDTDTNQYSFNFLIDCSGPNSILRKNIKTSKAFRFWLGKLKVIKSKIPSDLDTNYIHYSLGDNGYVEELNPHKQFITHGHWQFCNSLNFDNIKPPQNTLIKKYFPNYEVVEEHRGIINSTPRLPLIYKNFAFLGDSLGTATPSTVFGIRPALESSEILAKAIIIGNLNFYEKNWKKKYLLPYIKFLASKMDLYNNSKLEKFLKSYPPHHVFFRKLFSNNLNKGEYFKIMKNPLYFPKFSEDVTKLFPRHQTFSRLFYFLCIYLYYQAINLKYNTK